MRLAKTKHLFFRWPLEEFHMASPCKPTQLREFQAVAFEATHLYNSSREKQGREKKEFRSCRSFRSSGVQGVQGVQEFWPPPFPLTATMTWRATAPRSRPQNRSSMVNV